MCRRFRYFEHTEVGGGRASSVQYKTEEARATMGRKKKVIPTAEPPLADEEGSGGLDLEEEEEEEDSGRGLLIAVNKHVVNEEDDEEEGEGDEDSEAPKQREVTTSAISLQHLARIV